MDTPFDDGLTHSQVRDWARAHGFRLVPTASIRVASVSRTHDNMGLLHYGAESGYMRHVYGSLGGHLGHFLMEHGAIPVLKEMGGMCSTTFRATVTIIVEDPTFDHPYPLNMGSPPHV